MEDYELAERNYEKGLSQLKYTKTLIKQEIANLDRINNIITYRIDGDIMTSIIKKLTKASRQINFMITRFKQIEGEVMIPKRKL